MVVDNPDNPCAMVVDTVVECRRNTNSTNWTGLKVNASFRSRWHGCGNGYGIEDAWEIR